MPWKNPERWCFTIAEIAERVPTESGLYYVSGAEGYLFIGESADMRAALFEHVTGRNPGILLFKPLWFGFESCSVESRAARRDEMIAEYAPLCNWDRRLVEP